MKKRYTLSSAAIRHIFKCAYDGNAAETNDGSGGHSACKIHTKITAYEIIGVPKHKSNAEANDWFNSNKSTQELIRCGFPHVANYTFNNVRYLRKSMFPWGIEMEDLIKIIERALTSCEPSHTYNKASNINPASGKNIWVAPEDFERKLTDAVTGPNGRYVYGRAHGMNILGQLAGGEGGLTSAYPDTRECKRKAGAWP